MLGAIRNKSKGWLAYLIVGLITIPFALFGINEYFTGASNVVVATVDDEEISQEAFLTQFNPQKRRLQQELGQKYDNGFDAVLKRSVVEKMINERLLDKLSSDLAHVTTDAELSAIIQSNELFQVEGRFSIERYEQILRLNGYTKASYEASKASELTQTQVKYNLLDSAFITPGALARLSELNNQQRQVRYVVLNASDYLDKVKVDPQSVSQYFDNQKHTFFDKRQAQVDYVELSLEKIANSISASEDDLYNYYEEEQARFSSDEQRQAQHILVETQETADTVHDLLLKGADFAKLATQYSQDPGSKDNAGDLGFFTKGVMVGEFEQVVFAMTPGELSAPVKSEFGYHLIKLNAIKGGDTKAFDTVREEVKKLYTESEAQKQLYDLTEQMANLAYEASLDEVSAQMNLEVQSSEFFNEDSTQYDAKMISGAFSAPVFDKGENSEVLELSGNRYVVLSLKAKKAKRQKAFDEVKAEIEQTLSVVLAKTFVDEMAKKIANAFTQGELENAKALLKKNQLSLSESQWIARDDAKVEAVVATQLFAMSKPSNSQANYIGQALDSKRALVAELLAVKTSQNKAVDGALANMMSNYEADELFSSLLKSLRSQAAVHIFDERL